MANNNRIWGFNENDTNDGDGGAYFYGAAGTFNSSVQNDASELVLSSLNLGGPPPGQQPRWPMPRARTFAQPAAQPVLNYAAVASRAVTEADIEATRIETEKQEQIAREKEAEQQRNFHARSQPMVPICHFFPLGTCKHGQYCRYLHSTGEEQSEAGAYVYADKDADALGAWGGSSSNSSSSSSSSSGTVIAGTSSGSGNGTGNGSLMSRQRGDSYTRHSFEEGTVPATGTCVGTVTALASKAPYFEEAHECGICLADTPQENLYGILSHCNCVFCLPCIREWRAEGQARNPSMGLSDVRKCPLCRVSSFYVVPSTRTFTLKSLIVGDMTLTKIDVGAESDKLERQGMLQAEKHAFIDAYKRSLSQKPCRHYLKDRHCPFGTSCFYLHIDCNGELEQDYRESLDITTKPRYLLNADGETVVLQNRVGKDGLGTIF